MDTGMIDYLQNLIVNATNQKHSAVTKVMKTDTTLGSDKKIEKLEGMPHV